ncbi:MAG: S-layer homology domain-containing protein [Oscillospiraceae bacterium]|nr:S-layer homology domain-containing protein [Oscillospiraceae bacterium]
MWSKRLIALFLCLTLLSGISSALADEDEEEEQEEWIPLMLQTGMEQHTPYLRGYGDGTIRPDTYLTMAEGCQLIYGLLRYRPEDRAEIPGVEKGMWYYDAMSLLASRGILDLQRDGNILPDAAMSRGQFILMITRFFPELEEGSCSYPDVPGNTPWYGAVAKATGQGWIQGYEDGTFRPMGPLTRAEAAAVINRVLGRRADREALDAHLVIPLFTDLPASHWAYETLLEAAVSHTSAGAGEWEAWTEVTDPRLCYEPGPVPADGEVYWAGEDGYICRDTAVGNLYFGPDGRYTCGDEETDRLIKEILAGLYDPQLTREELLRAAFDYTVKSFAYLRRTESYEWGATGWEVEEANIMLNTGRGNCYSYAAVFCLLARQLGYDAEAVSGGVNWNPRPHGWVEIEFDGVPYIFDTELEMAKKGQYHFWKLAHEDVPWPYHWAETAEEPAEEEPAEDTAEAAGEEAGE